MEYLRTIAHLRPRSNTFSAVFRVRSLIAQAIHTYFHERGFVYVHTPIITTNDAEGAGEMFHVTTSSHDEFFGKPTSLTVSGQLNVEAYCLAFRNCYTFGPTFRAEHSYTPRHAAEFWMVEPEIAFADLSDNMDLAEDLVRTLYRTALIEASEELMFLDQFVDKALLERTRNVAEAKFARVSYTEVIDLLQKSKKSFEYPVKWGIDLQTEHERFISEEYFHGPVFIHDYPMDIKAFYMRQNDDGQTVGAVDLIVPGVGELVGGSQREERLDKLVQRMEALHLPIENYGWYLELRRFGSVPHAGFGLGFERLIMVLTGMSNIRDVLPFPRTTGSADF